MSDYSEHYSAVDENGKISNLHIPLQILLFISKNKDCSYDAIKMHIQYS